MDEKQFQQWLLTNVGKLQADVAEINVTLAAQHVSLVEHLRRTDLLEKKVDGLWFKVLSVVGGIAGIAAAVARFVWH